MSEPRDQPLSKGSPSLGLRALAAAVAALTLGAPLLDTLHAGSVAHVTCAEHGELVDADTGAQRAANSPHQHDDSGVLLSEHDRSSPLGSGQHEHCAIVLHSRLRARAAESRSPALVSSLRPAPARPLPEAPVLRSQAIYRLAPKSSPPLA